MCVIIRLFTKFYLPYSAFPGLRPSVTIHFPPGCRRAIFWMRFRPVSARRFLYIEKSSRGSAREALRIPLTKVGRSFSRSREETQAPGPSTVRSYDPCDGRQGKVTSQYI